MFSQESWGLTSVVVYRCQRVVGVSRLPVAYFN